jgi:hypothetical protein
MALLQKCHEGTRIHFPIRISSLFLPQNPEFSTHLYIRSCSLTLNFIVEKNQSLSFLLYLFQAFSARVIVNFKASYSYTICLSFLASSVAEEPTSSIHFL